MKRLYWILNPANYCTLILLDLHKVLNFIDQDSKSLVDLTLGLGTFVVGFVKPVHYGYKKLSSSSFFSSKFEA